MRFGELFGFVTPLLVASALAPQLTHRSVSLLDRRMAALARPASVGGLALAGAILLAISSVLLRSGAAPTVRAVTPAAAIAAVRASHVEGPALTTIILAATLFSPASSPLSTEGPISMETRL